MRFSSGRSDIWFSAVFCMIGNTYRLRIDVNVGTGEAQSTRDLFDELFERKEAIEAAVGESLEWDCSVGKRSVRNSLYFPSPIRVREKDRWPEARSWLIEALGRMRDAFDPVIAELP